MKNKKFIAFAIVAILAVSVFGISGPALAAENTTLGDGFGTGYLGGIGGKLPTTDIRVVAVNLINILLGVLGIIFLLLVLYGGFLWMTSAGNDEQASKGRKIIGNSIIGLIVIFVAFALTTFVFNILQDTVNVPTTGSEPTD